MPTAKRRMMITPTDKMWQVIDRYHAVTGQSKSRLVVDFLEPVVDQMGQVVDILEQVKSLQGDAIDGVREVAEEAGRRLHDRVQGAIEDMALVAAAASQKPPSSNTGATGSQVIEKAHAGKMA